MNDDTRQPRSQRQSEKRRAFSLDAIKAQRLEEVLPASFASPVPFHGGCNLRQNSTVVILHEVEGRISVVEFAVSVRALTIQNRLVLTNISETGAGRYLVGIVIETRASTICVH